MKIAIFGPTGGTGRQLVAQALARGDDVIILARRPEAVTTRDPRLTVIAGDVLKPGDCDLVVQGVDAVLSALGPGQSLRATTLFSVGTANITQAMKVAGVLRFIGISSSGAFLHGDPGARLIFRLLLPALLHNPHADLRRMDAQVKSTDLDWTLVRSTKLTRGPRTGKYRVATGQTPPGGWRVSRADLAAFMLDLVVSGQYARTTPVIAY
jgi:putative NADH-flavin reductase